MFNEAFWFFYWMDFAGSIKGILMFVPGVVLVLAMIGTVLTQDLWDSDEGEKFWGLWKAVGIPLAIIFFVGSFIPSERSFYAGAGQYVAESAEIDDTLLKLKDLIDQKIAEATSD